MSPVDWLPFITGNLYPSVVPWRYDEFAAGHGLLWPPANCADYPQECPF